MREKLKNAKRIVIKIGTSSLVYPNGNINLSGIDELSFVLADLNNQGKEVVLVSSGAIGVGMNQLGLTARPATIPEQQAVAALGQATLMNIYSQRLASYSKKAGQVLLTRDVIEYPESRKNVTNTLEQLLKMGIIPIINENDTVSVDELDHLTKFGDNDQLSAIVSQIIQADLLIMLSDINGFYSDNPNTNPQASLHTHIAQITPEIMHQAGGKGSMFGTGGMSSKLKAAKRILDCQSAMVLANGKQPKIIFDILDGQQIGTLFMEG
ncbi:glutamate 5-kinase [Enterococcus columbae]|uniref:Glutamate 5-kinase n=1 Tax=Enterococcus columbae DSM 7374 = ATCC 51263 TaxID=1121865 RepID=S0KIV8_9ENTE|nr:glutamate 5-kinase [Enterococcus columbae]EOT39121.1 glutamate 5-kinase [Enterococcus columbae DSM 7374 = ATCC 51263]EOW79946.1 glutamate 5-kinase [Enterococcus columbae DSM 7374 = ATCC 51263]OJG24569.1 glutamate 5-kinase [Enterococcus columbae DSM 7374 = ATCC 51263]